jgi:hypothetical protein
MTTLELRPLAPVNLTGLRLGEPQRSGTLTVVPVFGPGYPGITPPRSGVKLARVDGYGRVVLSNGGHDGVAIVPLHIGYIQDGAQNHALCRSGFLAPGQELLFPDAACVQETQGGYLRERDQWFFVLPVELRAKALELRGVPSYSKLWNDIAAFNRRYQLPARGHLEQVLSRKRGVLNQYQSRIELQPGQLGALFFLAGRLAGMEIAPDPRYFAEVWMALVCFAYGPAAWRTDAPAAPGPPLAVDAAGGLAGVRAALSSRRASVADEVAAWLAEANWQDAQLTEEERYLDLRLSTVHGAEMAGQVVTDGDRLVYASLFARETG